MLISAPGRSTTAQRGAFWSISTAVRSCRRAGRDTGRRRTATTGQGAVALLGPATPPLSIPVSFAAEALQVPAMLTITPIRAWQGAKEDGWQWSWDLFFDEEQMTETQFLAADLVETNRRVALFTDLEEDGIVMGDLWDDRAPDFGYEIVYRAEFPADAADLAGQVSEAMAADADIVIAQVIPPTGAALLEEFERQGWAPRLVFLEKAANTGAWPALTGGRGEGTLAANWFAEGNGTPHEAVFIDAYREPLGGVDSNLGVIVWGYSAARVLLDALERAGSVDPHALNEAIASTDGEYPAGRVRFDAGHASAHPAVQTQWQGTDMVLVMHADGSAGPAALRVPAIR